MRALITNMYLNIFKEREKTLTARYSLLKALLYYLNFYENTFKKTWEVGSGST